MITIKSGFVVAETENMRRRRAWACAAAMMSVILLSLPITPFLWRKAVEVFGPQFNILGYFVLVVLALVFAIYAVRRRDRLERSSVFVLGGLAVIYYWLLRYHCRFPAERLHLFEYGLLAYLLYRALRYDFPEMKAYSLGFSISSLFGLLDEIIQHFLPNRVFEWRDVATNVIASALGLVITWLLFRETSRPVTSSETTI
ncbi:VanZ family protein [Candidatus Poribacteria bacterium]|nr:VanZ family protein [Candidatus Poribacteria bacterium]